MEFLRTRFRNRGAKKSPIDDPETMEPPAEVLKWGYPSRCPKCQKRGYLSRVDAVQRVMHQHCRHCFSVWSVTESDVRTQTLPTVDNS